MTYFGGTSHKILGTYSMDKTKDEAEAIIERKNIKAAMIEEDEVWNYR